MGSIETNFPRAISVNVPGMHKATGIWAECRGIIRPVILVDPIIDREHGAFGVVVHEAEHANGYHGLASVLIGLSGAVGISLGGVCPWSLILGPLCAGFLLLWLRKAEILADRKVVRVLGQRQYRAMLYLIGAPKTRWGRWLYGSTLEARYKRAI